MTDRVQAVISPTPRERELMSLIARGLQNKNIAHELNISENTVRAHIGNIMRKYGLRNRTQIAIIFAVQASAPSLRDCANTRGAAGATPISVPSLALPGAVKKTRAWSRTVRAMRPPGQ